jgi:RES domain-containing protein
VVYLGRTSSGVLLEYIVHLLEQRLMPLDPTWIEALYPSSVQVEVVSESVLPAIWRAEPSITRAIGDKWLQESRTALLDVPSVIIPDARNCLLNPMHPKS